MNVPYGTHLTAPRVTTGGYADGKQLTKEGRHVGLDFYDLLIEALIEAWAQSRSMVGIELGRVCFRRRVNTLALSVAR